MRRVLESIAIVAVAVSLSSCALPFYWQAIGGQLELLRKRTPIEKLVADQAIDPALKERLRVVARIRSFAVTELGLPDNDSYTTYADISRPYVVWNVVAAAPLSVEPERWCFPVAGCVAYRGFFARDDAERFERRLAREGLDTYLGGATAYSTLGYFADPVLSTMLAGGEQYVASLIFHELAHQKLYVKGDSQFNESFASAVEEYGTERWLMRHGSPDALEQYRARLGRRGDFADLVLAQQRRLAAAYASGDSTEDKLAAKQRLFVQMRDEYAALKAQWRGAADYDAWFAQPLNNALLASVATYRRWVPALRRRIDELGLDGFYAEMGALAKLPLAERESRLETCLAEAPKTGSDSGV